MRGLERSTNETSQGAYLGRLIMPWTLAHTSSLQTEKKDPYDAIDGRSDTPTPAIRPSPAHQGPVDSTKRIPLTLKITGSSRRMNNGRCNTTTRLTHPIPFHPIPSLSLTYTYIPLSTLHPLSTPRTLPRGLASGVRIPNMLRVEP
jgi:hypothetical protein